MQQMEWRETFMDAKMDNDAAALNQLAQTITAEQQHLYQQLQTAFQSEQWHQAAECVRQGRFLNKLLQEIHSAQE